MSQLSQNNTKALGELNEAIWMLEDWSLGHHELDSVSHEILNQVQGDDYNSLFKTALFPTLSMTSIFKVLGFGSVK